MLIILTDMKRPNEYIITSHRQRKQEQHSTPVCAGQKRHHEESQPGLKKPNLDIKTGKTGVCVYVMCLCVRFTANCNYYVKISG